MTRKNKKRIHPSTKRKHSPHIVNVTRKIKDLTRLLLFVRAGGRCEFDGCNRDLLEHHVTLTEGNFAQMAHIVAFSVDGPRGRSNRPKEINAVDNLMALCPACHKLIDDDPEKFTKATLVTYKEQHERRVKYVTGLNPDQKTSVVILKSKIGQQTVAVPFDHVLEATAPRYPASRDGLVIDLTVLPTDSSSFLGAACDTIKTDLQTFFGPTGEYRKTGHISLFALSSIPILAYFGTQLSSKVPAEIYQRHRDSEKWTWKRDGKTSAAYSFRRVRPGNTAVNVALVMSLSGAIPLEDLPASIDNTFSVYELTLDGATPSPTFLNTRADLREFRIAYQGAIATITKEHPGITSVHVFPAVPAPVAVLIGRELLPKAHPELRIYDRDKAAGGFVYQLTINN